MSLTDSIKNAAIASSSLSFYASNAPKQYAGKQTEYFAKETKTYTQMYAKYASDFVEARVQGLDPNAPYAWQTRLVRMADVVKPTAAIQRHFDDYKMVLFADRDVEYITPGSKINTMGSIWLAVNPLNVSGSDGITLVRRCNAVWNYLDFYGNVVSEPILVENERANANDSDVQQSQLITKGYFNVICQYNDATRQIDTNTRLILGTAAYRVTGYSDFEQQFTGDYGSVRLLSFAVRYEEANDAIDDMVNHVAGGKTFSWDVSVTGVSAMRAGQTAQFAAVSSRNDMVVAGTPEKPISYLWESSDESVAAVDSDGNVTAVAEGDVTITATLIQNETYSASASVTVTESVDGVDFTDTVPARLSAFESVTISGAYFVDGEDTKDALAWAFSGADGVSYSAAVARNGRSAVIQCFGYSSVPLTVTISHGEYEASAEIALEGI